MENNLDTTKPLYSERILPVFWPFVTSSLYCILSWKALLRVLPPKLSPTYLATNQVLQDAWIQTSDWLKLRGRHAIQGVKSLVKKNWKIELLQLYTTKREFFAFDATCNNVICCKTTSNHTSWELAWESTWEQDSIRFEAKEVVLSVLLPV